MLDHPSHSGESFFFEEQGRLDRVLLNVAPFMSVWNDMLKEKYYDAQTAPDGTMGELKSRAVSHLDNLWPYLGHVINVTGVMYDTDIQAPEDNSIIGTSISRKEIAGAFRSNGFGIVEIDRDLPPVVCLSFITGSGRFPLPGAQALVTTLGYVRPEEASLIIGEKSDDKQEMSSLGAAVEEYNLRIRKSIYKNKTPFMNLDYTQQLQTLSDVEQQATRALAMDGYALKVAAPGVPYVYTASTLDNEIRRIDTSDSGLVAGEVLGACILESLIAPPSAIRSSRDFIDTRAGLCLMIDVGDERFGKKVVLVPSACAESIQFSL